MTNEETADIESIIASQTEILEMLEKMKPTAADSEAIEAIQKKQSEIISDLEALTDV